MSLLEPRDYGFVLLGVGLILLYLLVAFGGLFAGAFIGGLGGATIGFAIGAFSPSILFILYSLTEVIINGLVSIFQKIAECWNNFQKSEKSSSSLNICTTPAGTADPEHHEKSHLNFSSNDACSTGSKKDTSKTHLGSGGATFFSAKSQNEIREEERVLEPIEMTLYAARGHK